MSEMYYKNWIKSKRNKLWRRVYRHLWWLLRSEQINDDEYRKRLMRLRRKFGIGEITFGKWKWK